MSIPKKAAPVSEPEAEEPVKPAEEPQQPSASIPDPAAAVESDARTSALQALLDKYQEKTEKEVVRVLKVRVQSNLLGCSSLTFACVEFRV